jgi:chromosomal replication initiator protein
MLIDLKTLWKQAVAPLAASMPGEDFDTWIEPMRPVEFGGDVLEVAVPNRMFAAWIEENYLDDLARSWARASGRKTRIEFTWGQLSNQGELFTRQRSQQPQQAALFSDDETTIPAPVAKPRLAARPISSTRSATPFSKSNLQHAFCS